MKKWNKKNFQFKPESDLVLITSHGAYRRLAFDENTGSNREKEFFIEPFQNILNKNNIPFLCIDLDYTFYGTPEKLANRLKDDENWIPYELFFELEKCDITYEMSILKKNIFNLLKHDESFPSYRSLKISQLLEHVLEPIFLEPYLPTFLKLEKNLESFFKKFPPKTIIQVYEHGPLAKAFEIAAKKCGIPTVGIQHGLIDETTHDYLFKQTKSKMIPLGNPIPDNTCVFGQFFKDLLVTNGSYPNEKITNIGNPTFYNLEKKIDKLNKNTIKQNYKINSKFVILIPLSNVDLVKNKNNFEYQILDLIYKKFNRKDTVILLRLHPLVSFKREMLEKLFPNNDFIISSLSLLEDIFVSDLVIGLRSTVTIESAILKKPVLFYSSSDISNLPLLHRRMIDYKLAKLVISQNLIESIDFSFENYETNLNNSKYNDFMNYCFNNNIPPNLLQIILGNKIN